VPHNVVEPKTESKKKLVMQLDRDVQVCGIFFFIFLSSPCFEILLLCLEGGHASYIFSMLFYWNTHFLYASLSIYFSSFFFFFNDPFLLLQEEKSLWNLEYLFLVDGWHVLRNSRYRS
jgi:hypothetical protein